MSIYTSREDEEFFGAIGRLTVSWAHLEMGLDCVIEILHHAFGGKEIERVIPWALKRKIRYLRAYIKRYPLPEEVMQNYNRLFDEILAASETRHNIIHGAIIEHAERSGEATFIRILRKKGHSSTKEIKIRTKDILMAAREAQKLSSKTLLWATETQKFVHELLQQRDEQNQS